MLDQTDFNQWFIDNDDMPEARVSGDRLKVLIGSMWVNFHDLPEAMARGVIQDFKKAQLASLIAKHQF
jgi:hypothetical protein